MPSLYLTADRTHLVAIRHFVETTCRAWRLDEDAACEVRLAVDEACANIVEHAYADRGGEIELHLEPITGGLRAVLRDYGAPFDPESVPVPDVDAPLEERTPGGLGLFLMRKIMDSVEFRFDGPRGNTLTMVKRVPADGAIAQAA